MKVSIYTTNLAIFSAIMRTGNAEIHSESTLLRMRFMIDVKYLSENINQLPYEIRLIDCMKIQLLVQNTKEIFEKNKNI